MTLHLLGKENFHEVNPMVAQGDFQLDKLSRDLVSMAEAQWRHESSEIMDKGFFAHTAAPFEPFYQLN
jgi:hypothetical protein